MTLPESVLAKLLGGGVYGDLMEQLGRGGLSFGCVPVLWKRTAEEGEEGLGKDDS